MLCLCALKDSPMKSLEPSCCRNPGALILFFITLTPVIGFSCRFPVDISATDVRVLATNIYPLSGFLIHTDLKPLCRRDESLVFVFRQSESAEISMNAKAGFHLRMMRSPPEAEQD